MKKLITIAAVTTMILCSWALTTSQAIEFSAPQTTTH
jgi:hypothetical protein